MCNEIFPQDSQELRADRREANFGSNQPPALPVGVISLCRRSHSCANSTSCFEKQLVAVSAAGRPCYKIGSVEDDDSKRA